MRSETGMESWFLLLSWSGDGLEHVLSNHSVSVIIWVDSVIHELRAAQVITSKGLKVVDDVLLTKS